MPFRPIIVQSQIIIKPNNVKIKIVIKIKIFLLTASVYLSGRLCAFTVTQSETAKLSYSSCRGTLLTLCLFSELHLDTGISFHFDSVY